MTLTLNLSPELEQRLEAAAQAQGVAPADFALQLLDQRLADADRCQRAIARLRFWRDPALADASLRRAGAKARNQKPHGVPGHWSKPLAPRVLRRL
jgi:hypothetical protein